MSEYINKNTLAEKIVVSEALIKEERNADYENMETYNGMIRGLVEAQRLMLETDTIEIVRCKDCKYYTESIYFAPDKACYRYKDNEGNKIGYIKSGNDYCSAGERRE